MVQLFVLDGLFP